MTQYGMLPEHMQDGTRDYVERHIAPGGFLYAVLCNDLVGAFEKADAINRGAMAVWARWLWWEAPSECWGSSKKVDAWLAKES